MTKILRDEYIENSRKLKELEKQIYRSLTEGKILRLISQGENLVIDATDGTQTIVEARDIFRSGIDAAFKNWGTNKASEATEETPVQVYEMYKQNATLAQIFGSLSKDLDKLCFTQSQIINFCEKYSDWLRQDGHATFFMFKVNGQFLVALVYVNADGLDVLVNRLGHDRVWLGGYRRRVITPQLVA